MPVVTPGYHCGRNLTYNLKIDRHSLDHGTEKLVLSCKVSPQSNVIEKIMSLEGFLMESIVVSIVVSKIII